MASRLVPRQACLPACLPAPLRTCVLLYELLELMTPHASPRAMGRHVVQLLARGFALEREGRKKRGRRKKKKKRVSTAKESPHSLSPPTLPTIRFSAFFQTTTRAKRERCFSNARRRCIVQYDGLFRQSRRRTITLRSAFFRFFFF